MHEVTISDLARALDAQLWGDGAMRVYGAAEPAQCGPGQIALAMAPKYAEALKPGSAAILAQGMNPEDYGLAAAIFAPRPRLVMAGLTRSFDPGPDIAPGIHDSAVIDPGAEIAEGAAIGPFVVIGADVRIGPEAHREPCLHRKRHADRRPRADPARRPDPARHHHRRRVVIQPGAIMAGRVLRDAGGIGVEKFAEPLENARK